MHISWDLLYISSPAAFYHPMYGFVDDNRLFTENHQWWQHWHHDDSWFKCWRNVLCVTDDWVSLCNVFLRLLWWQRLLAFSYFTVFVFIYFRWVTQPGVDTSWTKGDQPRCSGEWSTLSNLYIFTCWGLNQQQTFCWHYFQIFFFWSKQKWTLIDWSLSLCVHLTASQHWFR